MLTLLVSVEASAGKVIADPEHPLGGYYQTFGVTARSESELRNLVRDYLAVDLQSDLVEICETWEPDWEGSDRDIREQVGDLAKIGIWYRSGRAWFAPQADSE